MDALLDEWDSNRDNPREEFWQGLLARNAWVFSQLTGSPVVLLQERAYIGGKDITNTGGGMVDFLLANSLTDNVALVEIKTPVAALCEAQYRTSGAHVVGKDVVGGLVQVLGYRNTFLTAVRDLRKPTDTYEAYAPRCFLVVGTVDALDTEAAKRSFELFRTTQAGVEILAFDELRQRIQGVRDALTATDNDAGAPVPAA